MIIHNHSQAYMIMKDLYIVTVSLLVSSHISVLYMYCDFLWPEVQPHSDDSQMRM